MKAKRLTDIELAGRAAEYRRLRSMEKSAGALADAERDVILAELAARRAQTVAVPGFMVTLKSNRRTEYDPKAAKEALTPAKYRRITQTSVVHVLVQAELKAGQLTEEEVDAFRTVSSSAPYLTITPQEAA